MKILSADEILSATDHSTETVLVPEWGGAVIVSTITQSEDDAFNDSLYTEVRGKLTRNSANATARYLAICLVDEKGKKLFSPDQIEALGKKSAPAMQRVEEVCKRINRKAHAEAVDLAKNSEPGPGNSP